MNRTTRFRRLHIVVPTLAVVLLGAVAVVFRDPLSDWFFLPSTMRPHSSSTEHAHGELSEASLAAVREAMDAYEGVRVLLAADRIDGVADGAHAVAEDLRIAQDAAGEPEATIATALRLALAAADQLAHQPDLNAARLAFADLSYVLISLASEQPQLQENWVIYRCPMTPGFGKWFQRKPPLENPYMGSSMLRCGSESTWEVSAGEAPKSLVAQVGTQRGSEPAFYTCPMHPSVRQKSPGACPICGMDLVAVTRDEQHSGVVLVDAVRRQQIGVRTAPVRMAPMRLDVRAVGRITYDETRLYDVSFKQPGWVTDLQVNTTGQWVEKGQVLFTLYSPELYAAQQEYLVARRSQSAGRDAGSARQSDTLVDAAHRRLRLADVSDAQLAEIVRMGRPRESLSFVSPVAGYVVEKDIVAGSAIEAGQRLFRIADLQRIWVEADIYESDLPAIRLEQRARVRLPYPPGREIDAQVSQLLPFIDATTRTARVRLELDNPDLEFKPGMFADVMIEVDLGERLQVPSEAVLFAGPRHLVFVDLGEGRLQPKEITLGARSGDAYEVLSGLEEGQVVVTSGNFLLAAESRLRSATNYWGGDSHGSH